jgi:hypothetical protein
MKIYDDDNDEIATFIGLKNIEIKSFEFQKNIMLISPEITIEKDSVIDLSNKTPPRIRKHSSNVIYPGLDGLKGYDLKIASKKFNVESNSFTFISKGSPGGLGNPNGHEGHKGIIDTNNKIHISRYRQLAFSFTYEFPELRNDIKEFFEI